MDEDLAELSREELTAEIKRLRAGIRKHRDSSGQDLCWFHPELWGLLPETVSPDVAVPAWPGATVGGVLAVGRPQGREPFCLREEWHRLHGPEGRYGPPEDRTTSYASSLTGLL